MVMPLKGIDSVVVSSGFDSGTDGWLSYGGSTTLTQDGGRLKVSASIVWGTVDKPLTTSGTYEGTFTASSNSMLLLFEMIPGVNPPPDSTGYYWLDNVSVEEVNPVESTVVENGGYRYGFNGQEKSNEIYGQGNAYNFGARIQDPRLGRFFSIDKLGTGYKSDYSFGGNSPISSIDYNGDVEIIVTTHKTDKNGKLTVTTARYVIETVEDIRGIARDAYKIDIYQKEVLMSQQVGNATYTWYGWKTSSITQDKESGKTPEERRFTGVGGWIAKNLYELSISINPVAKLGNAIGYDRDQITGESKSVSQRAFQASEAVFDAITLGRGKIAKEGAKKILIEYLGTKVLDYGVEDIISYSVNKLGFDKEKSVVLGYNLYQLARDAKKGKIDDIYKLLQRATSIGQKTEDTIKELNNYGVDLNMPKDGNAAVSKALQGLGAIQ